MFPTPLSRTGQSNTTTPIARLTADVLSDIFLIGLFEDITENGSKLLWEDGVGDTPTLPVIVSSVCSYWRQVALGTVRLWAVIRLNCRGQRWSAAAPLYTWLDRSGDALLDIRITIGQTRDEVRSAESVEFANTIFTHHLSRCRRLRLCILDIATLVNTIGLLKTTSLTAMSEFEISAVRPFSMPAIPEGYGPTMFHSLWPALRHLRRLHIREMDSSLILNEEFRDYLGVCESLAELSIDHVLHIHGANGDDDDSDGNTLSAANSVTDSNDLAHARGSATTVLMRHLHNLLLVALPVHWVAAFLSRLDAPSLRSLITADFLDGETTVSVQRGLALLDLSRLESFRWYAGRQIYDLTAEDILLFLDRMPSLKRLDVGDLHGPADQVLDALLLQGVQSRLCPNLTWLRIYISYIRAERCESEYPFLSHDPDEIWEELGALRDRNEARSEADAGPFVDLEELLRLRRASGDLCPICHLSLMPVIIGHEPRHIERLRGLVDRLVVEEYTAGE